MSKVTIGDGVTSVGTHNLPDYPGTYELFEEALADGNRNVEVLPGSFPAPARSILLEDGATIRGTLSSFVHCANGEPAFDVSGISVLIDTLHVLEERDSRADLVTIKDSESVTLRGLRLHPASPMSLAICAWDSVDIDIGGCRVMPCELGTSEARALVCHAINLLNVEHVSIRGCRFMDLGTQEFPTNAVIHSDVANGAEGGHLTMIGNHIERIVLGAEGRVGRFLGGRFITIGPNVVGRCEGDLPAFLFSGEPSGKKGGPVIMTGCDVHNTGAPVVEIQNSPGCAVVGNAFTLMPAGTVGSAVSVDAASTDCVIGPNVELE